MYSNNLMWIELKKRLSGEAFEVLAGMELQYLVEESYEGENALDNMHPANRVRERVCNMIEGMEEDIRNEEIAQNPE